MLLPYVVKRYATDEGRGQAESTSQSQDGTGMMDQDFLAGWNLTYPFRHVQKYLQTWSYPHAFAP